jgi:hypothetical protein
MLAQPIEEERSPCFMAARSVLKGTRAGNRDDDWRRFRSSPMESLDDLESPAPRMVDIDQDNIRMKLRDCSVHPNVVRFLDLYLNLRQFGDLPHQTLTDRRLAFNEKYLHVESIIKSFSS